MSADLLREAATILRERAEAATLGPWRDIPMGSEGSTIIADPPAAKPSIITSRRVGRFPEFADAMYAATVQPAVGLALADLLDIEATRLDDTTVCDAPTQCSNCSAPHWSFVSAVEIARLIVGGAP